MGILVGLDNGYGVTGLVPDATPWFFTTGSDASPEDRATAIIAAIDALDPYDVMLLEMQSVFNGQAYFGPAELELSVYEATVLATDSDIIVVAAAGNGELNLDVDDCDPDGAPPGCAAYRLLPDSGAILVGAATADVNHDRIDYSTYGSRVNMQGWGVGVFTLGEAGDSSDIIFDDDPNQSYRVSFGGTSSASPFVAGCAVALQSLAIDVLGAPLDPWEMRELLVSTGIPQGTATASEHIGPFPNMAAAIVSLLGPSVDCDGNDVPDECESTPGACCDGVVCQVVPENCCTDPGEVFAGYGTDCSGDCNENGVPDECDPDCNENGIPDECDLADCSGDPACEDCDGNGVPDECDPDCNENGIPEECESMQNGACCLINDCLPPMTQCACEAMGGMYQGFRSTCGPFSCINYGPVQWP
jgi:hypothetical protein